MPALDQEKRKTFTLLYVSTGNATQAAIGAGCPPPPGSAAVTAHRWLRNPAVLALLRELTPTPKNSCRGNYFVVWVLWVTTLDRRYICLQSVIKSLHCMSLNITNYPPVAYSRSYGSFVSFGSVSLSAFSKFFFCTFRSSTNDLKCSGSKLKVGTTEARPESGSIIERNEAVLPY